MSKSRTKTTSYPDRTVVRFLGEADEYLNDLLDATEAADKARASYRTIFIQTLVLTVMVALQLLLKSDPGLILRGVILALVITTGCYYGQQRFAVQRYERIRADWREANQDDPDWKEEK